jgi:hypothetical protein
MKHLPSYLRALLGSWFGRFFVLVDIIGIIALIFTVASPSFPIPQWSLWLILCAAAFTLVAANASVYAGQRAKLEQLTTSHALLRFVPLKRAEGESMYLSVYVYNDETTRHVKIAASLESLSLLYPAFGPVPKEKSLNYPKFSWHKGSPSPFLTIQPGDMAILNIACWQSGRLAFTFQDETKMAEAGKYTYTLKLLGDVGERVMAPRYFAGEIEATTLLEIGHMVPRFRINGNEITPPVPEPDVASH